ncbi:uncharacterized protein LOC127723432 [Mytilus californianus]|uniref:uncharacterized protein LOC127723432 n=1 Tax=Mytilus californianus TaxID=6549 RepID=UPI0022454C70|nr:uncharacterized protein LOC127723432 [Mytilus californianus]XP_052086015.1 uncharacterized protein LOC127723432 [Mytilus californianus]XP_052086016.1 uncharacterized protein LOC127723432 [Mytilus californianus]
MDALVDYKSILVKNNTFDTECQVIVYFYSKHDPVCLISSSSKILRRGEAHLHRYKDGFKFKIKTIYEKSKTTVVKTRKWEQDMHFSINSSQSVTESDLEDHVLEKTMCIRKLNVEKQASLDDGRNLYEILKLNMEEIRKLDKEKQETAIRKSFLKEILRWHPDTAGENADNDMTQKVYEAYHILRDPKERGKYHNRVDYSQGWLSVSRWKSIFRPEYKTKYKTRLCVMIGSLLLGAGGLALCIGTAGLAAPAAVVVGGILGAGFFGGSLQSFFRSINRKSIEEGCDFKDYAKSFGLGFGAGLVSGGAGVGITAAIAGIGSAAAQASVTTVGQFIGMGAGSSAVGGAAFSLAADAEKKLVDGKNVTFKEVVVHALTGAAIGGVTGIAVGAVAGSLTGLSAEVSATNIEERLVPGARRFGVALAKSLSKGVTNKSTESVLELVKGYVAERLDDEQENRPVTEHLIEGGKKLAESVVLEIGINVGATTVDHVSNEIKVDREVKKKPENQKPETLDTNGNLDNIERSTDLERPCSTPDFKSRNKCNNLSSKNEASDNSDTAARKLQNQHERQKARYNLDQKLHLTYRECMVETNTDVPCLKRKPVIYDTEKLTDEEKKRHLLTSARFIYLSKGYWMSKMFVEYTDKDNELQKKETKSGKAIEIPIDAKHVKIFFKVMRFAGVWCFVTKLDRFKKEEPHIFTYERPPEERRFTLDGSLYFVRVTQVTNERFDDVIDI